LAVGGEFFTVGTNPWEVGHYMTCFGLYGGKKDGSIDSYRIAGYRKGYITCVEAYSMMPSVFDNMTPASDIWWEGQGGLKEGKEDWQYLVQRCHENGMAVVTYIQYFSYGADGFDFARRHPGWLTYGKDGRPNAWFDVDQLTAMRYEPELQKPNTPGGITCGLFVPSNQAVGDYWIDQCIKSSEMFGWDGFRSDGEPGLVEGYNYAGKLEPLADPGPSNAAFMAKTRQTISAHRPGYLFGWNTSVFGYPEKISSEEEFDVIVPGSYCLYEFFNSAGQPSSVYHPWKKAAFYLEQEATPIRRRGGFSHAGWMPSNRYLEAVASASGVQIDTWSQPANYRQFEFRWAEFLWDCNLRYVRPGASAVQVEGPAQVWWEDFVHTRVLPGGGKRVIVHLLNMPDKDDTAWADKPPAPAENVKVTFAAPPGMKLARIGAISPDVPGDVIPVTPAADGSVTIPQVALWTAVVAEFK
jgi:hypothetical protein